MLQHMDWLLMTLILKADVVLSVEDPRFSGGDVLILNSLIVQFSRKLHENVNPSGGGGGGGV